jgi:PAS domain S-box-containing protein
MRQLLLTLCLGMALDISTSAAANESATATQAATDCAAGHCAAANAMSGEADEAIGPFSWLLDTAPFPPRWKCGTWTAELGWLHIVSDAAIFAAYFMIPCVLLYFLLRRPDLPFPKIIWLFATFILACGFGHLVEAGIFWWPIYRFSGAVKAFTAIISCFTVLALIRLMPEIMKLPSAALLAKQLTESQERLEVALDAGNIGCWEWNVQDDQLTFDRRMRELFDVPEERGIQRFDDFAARVHPGDRERIGQAVTASVTTGDPFGQSYRIVHRDGSIRHIHAEGRTIHDAEGQVVQMVGVCQDFTAKQRQDELLAESEANYRGSFENVALGIAHVAPDGKFLRVNLGLCTILGYRPEELLQQRFQDITHADDLEDDVECVRQALIGEIDHYTMEKRYLRRDGSVAWANLSVSLLRGPDGAAKHFVSVVEDIGRRKAAETALQDTHQQLQKLSLVASKTQHSVVISDAQGRIEWVNDAFTELTGFGLDAIIGRKPGDLLQGPKTDPTTVREIRSKLAAHKSIATEIVNYSATGREYWIELKIDPVFGEQGQLSNFIATQVDITERKLAEFESRRAKARFDSLLKSDIVGVLTCHTDGTIDQANNEFLRIVDYSQEDLAAGRLNWQAMTPAEWREQDERILQQVIETGSARPCEKEYFNKQGQRVPIVVGMVRLDAEQDMSLKFVLDATEQKRTEESLRMAKRTAEEASRAKSDFLASMSHELRTPLNGVIGMTELLAETDLDERQRRFVKACQSSGQSLLALVNDILDFSKIEARQLELDQHPFDLLELLTDIMDTLALRIQGKEIELFYSLAHPGTLMLEGDSHRLRQVLVNLLGNAAKFTDRGEISLRVTPLELTESDATIRFSIKDTGIGIPHDRRDRLFREFSQVDSSTSRKYGGTGLGLSICKSIVEAMHGEIGVESIEGIGSEFWFTVRLRLQPQAGPIGLDKTAGLNVLVIGDNDSCRRHLIEALQAWGMSVRTAADVPAALASDALVGSEPAADLVVLSSIAADAGERAVTALRGQAARKDLPLVQILPIGSELALTTHEPLTRVLRRPVGQSDLLNAIVELMCPWTNSAEDKRQPEAEVAIAAATTQVRILVAEDNETNQLFAREILSRGGWACEIAANGTEALAALEKQRYDLVLMDCQMPEMDGFMASREIRAREADGRLPGRVPIIALTANAVKGDRENCLAAGMDDYISKPLSPAELKAAIARHLQASKEADLEPEKAPPAPQSQGTPAVIQQEELLARCLDDASFAAEMLASFERDGQARFAEIEGGVAAGNLAAVAGAAHRLKGISGIVAAHSIHRLSNELEAAGHDRQAAVVARIVAELRGELAACLAQLPQLTARLKEGSVRS